MSCRTRPINQLVATNASDKRPEAFDLWLRRQLETAYGRADQEPMSPELEAILNLDRR